MGTLNKIKRAAGVIMAAGAMAFAGIFGAGIFGAGIIGAGSVGPGAVANATPVTKVGSDPVTPVNPRGHKSPATKVGSDPVTSAINGITDAVGAGTSGAEAPSLVSPWPGGAWAGHDWSKGYPGGGYANGKGGGAASHGKAGGAWLHRD
ncbi:hypothetical protein A5740_07585 [Mycobacterium sp. GA-1841]|nr:hypothetical protein A5740_07585 [Mycobacterium sp. GA-1841]